MFNFDDLDNCTGTECYYTAPLIWFKYTDGVRFVAKNGGAWLVQDISLFTAKHRNDDFISIQAEFKNHKADIHFSDGNGNEWRKYHVAHTPDFKEGTINFYIIDGICLLANEY